LRFRGGALVNSSLWVSLMLENQEWSAIDILNRGAREDTVKLTMAITTTDADLPIWDSIITQLQEELSLELRNIEVRYGQQLRFVLEGYESDTSDLPADEKSEYLERKKYVRKESNELCRISKADFRNTLAMGSSIGAKTTGPGTFGGHIQVKLPGIAERLVLGISNHHVLQKGIDPFDRSTRETVTITAPDQGDIDVYVQNLTRDLYT
jgi:hypothetical protein